MPLQRGVDAVAVLPVPVVVEMELGGLQPAIEVLVARVLHVRLPLAEAPVANLLLPHRLVVADVDSAVAALLLEEADLGIERLAGAPVLEPGPMLPVVVFRVDVVGEVAAGESGVSVRAAKPAIVKCSPTPSARVGAPRAIPVVGSRQVAGGGAIDEHRADAGPVAQLAADAQHREVVAGLQRRRRRSACSARRR